MQCSISSTVHSLKSQGTQGPNFDDSRLMIHSQSAGFLRESIFRVKEERNSLALTLSWDSAPSIRSDKASETFGFLRIFHTPPDDVLADT